jgi:hypothetical protein
MQRGFGRKFCKSSKIDQITQNQSKYQENLDPKYSNIMIQIARITCGAPRSTDEMASDDP